MFRFTPCRDLPAILFLFALLLLAAPGLDSWSRPVAPLLCGVYSACLSWSYPTGAMGLSIRTIANKTSCHYVIREGKEREEQRRPVRAPASCHNGTPTGPLG